MDGGNILPQHRTEIISQLQHSAFSAQHSALSQEALIRCFG